MKLFRWKKEKNSNHDLWEQEPTILPTQMQSEVPVIQRFLSYQVANLQGIGTRRQQEDSFAFVNAIDVTAMKEKGLLAIVADGMGGMKGGKQASELTVSCLKEDFEKIDREQDLAFQLKESVRHASEKVYQLLHGEGGSTIVACMLFEEQLYYVSAGDSYLYLKRGNHLTRINREHNVRMELYSEEIESGNMNPERARLHPEAAALTQFLGKDQIEDIDYFHRPLRLEEDDCLLICSDGVGGVLNEEEILFALHMENPARSCQCMENMIKEKGNPYQDNYTALVISCGY